MERLVIAEKKGETAYELVQESLYSLSLQQQRTVLYLISLLSAYDNNNFELYEFSVQEFYGVCGFDEAKGQGYQDLKDIIKEICDKRIWVTLDNGQKTVLRWIEKVYIDAAAGLVQVQFDKYMMPYLLQLKKTFIEQGLIDLSLRDTNK